MFALKSHWMARALVLVSLTLPTLASADGLARIHSGARAQARADAPRATGCPDMWQQECPRAYEPTPARAPGYSPPRPARGGLLPATGRSADRSLRATQQALDPIVDPVLGTTAEAVGTVAGTALGVGLYPPLKVLEHVLGAH